MSEQIERLRKHVEFHKGNERAMFSIAGLEALLDLLKVLTADNITLTVQRDVMKAQNERLLTKEGELKAKVEELNFQIEHLEACVTIHDRNCKELKAQVDRLLAKEAERIGKELRRVEKYEGENHGNNTRR